MQRLLGVLVCLCLVVQPLVVPLHLALADHTYGVTSAATEAATHAHLHGHGHHHPHPHAHPAGASETSIPDDGSHPRHPAEDHLGQQQVLQQAPPPTEDAPVAALPSGVLGGWVKAVSAPLRQCPSRAPEPPPPRALPQPRAPPAVVGSRA